jgi:hypothetical protein
LRTFRLGLATFLPLGFPSFISSCGLGGWRSNSCIVRSVFSSTWGLFMPIYDPDEAWKDFYLEYGPAMFAWQLLESELATLFAIVCKIQPAMAIQIFYSATSFNARTDMFSAALGASKADDDAITFARALIKKIKAVQRISQQVRA